MRKTARPEVDWQQLRSGIRDALHTGRLPLDLAGRDKIVGAAASGPCDACGQPGAHVAYLQRGGHTVHFHSACEAVWREERAWRG